MIENLLIIGECGTGKSWTINQFIQRIHAEQLGKVGMFRFHFNPDLKVIVPGIYDGTTFAGSDKLSRALMRDLDLWRASTRGWKTVCEGDRFMNATYIEAVKPTILKISGTGEAGRKKRKSNQSERQLKAIRTRVNKIKAHQEFNTSDECLKFLVSLFPIKGTNDD